MRALYGQLPTPTHRHRADQLKRSRSLSYPVGCLRLILDLVPPRQFHQHSLEAAWDHDLDGYGVPDTSSHTGSSSVKDCPHRERIRLWNGSRNRKVFLK